MTTNELAEHIVDWLEKQDIYISSNRSSDYCEAKIDGTLDITRLASHIQECIARENRQDDYERIG